MRAEQWRPVVGAGGLYEVSDHGRVRSLQVWRGAPGPRFIHVGTLAKGHKKVWLKVAGERLPRFVHRLVLAAFVGPCPPGMEVRHIDGDPSNNNIENLAYGTPSENVLDSVRHGTHRNAGKTHCMRGHEFTAENTIPTRRGRSCRACANARARQRRKTPQHREDRNTYMREYNRRLRGAA